MRNIKTLLMVSLIALLIGAVIVKLDYDKSLTTPNSESSDKIEFVIEEGEAVDQILNSLIDNGLLQKKYYYYTKAYIRLNDLSSKIQAGAYELPKNLNIEELISTLQSGKEAQIWVLIQEGLRKDEIAEKLALELASTSFSESEFLSLTEDKEYIDTLGLTVDIDNLEGYIFPDNYAFAPDTTSKEVLTTMVENFKTKVGTNDTYEDIIVASLIEREGFDNTDRPIISGIIWKRYEEGWKLGLDVTLLYYLKSWDHELLTADVLEADTPYNTRTRVGLVPTPICNPGLESINAMRNPVETDYYYFIRGNDNITHYGVTYEDHQYNVANYLQ